MRETDYDRLKADHPEMLKMAEDHLAETERLSRDRDSWIARYYKAVKVGSDYEAERDRLRALLGDCRPVIVGAWMDDPPPDWPAHQLTCQSLLADINRALGDCGCRHGVDPGGAEHSGETP